MKKIHGKIVTITPAEARKMLSEKNAAHAKSKNGK